MKETPQHPAFPGKWELLITGLLMLQGCFVVCFSPEKYMLGLAVAAAVWFSLELDPARCAGEPWPHLHPAARDSRALSPDADWWWVLPWSIPKPVAYPWRGKPFPAFLFDLPAILLLMALSFSGSSLFAAWRQLLLKLYIFYYNLWNIWLSLMVKSSQLSCKHQNEWKVFCFCRII